MVDLKNIAGKVAKDAITKEVTKKVIVNDLLTDKPKVGKGKIVGWLAAAGAAITMIAQYLGG